MVKGARTAEFYSKGVGDEGGSAVCGNPEGLATLALLVPSAEKMYLAVREEYIIFEGYDRAT